MMDLAHPLTSWYCCITLPQYVFFSFCIDLMFTFHSFCFTFHFQSNICFSFCFAFDFQLSTPSTPFLCRCSFLWSTHFPDTIWGAATFSGPYIVCYPLYCHLTYFFLLPGQILQFPGCHFMQDQLILSTPNPPSNYCFFNMWKDASECLVFHL